MWPPSSNNRQINYGLPHEMGMVGLRDVFVVAPASSFHHHHHHHDPANSAAIASASDPNYGLNSATTLGVGVGVFPLLNIGVDQDDLYNTTATTRGGRNAVGGGNLHQFWQNQTPQTSNYLKKPMVIDQNTPQNLLQGGGGGMGGGSGSSSTTTCQDCGNQAKKDCSHRRCRTCCKSRGFDCATHVKSTWVPAQRRRERQLMAAAAPAAGSSGSTSGTKKPRLITSQTTTTSHTSASNTPPRSFDTSSSHQEASFKDGLPGQVRAPAVFKCVRVTAVDDGDDEYAYQAVVKIGGHVFKGFLYDQGTEGRGEEFPNMSELHLGGGGGGGRNGGSSTSPILDPSDVYAPSGAGGLLGGSGYGNQIN